MCEFLFSNTEAGMYLQKFAWLVVPMGLAQITTSVLNSLGDEKFVFYSYFASAFAIILALVILPQFIGVSSLLVGLALQNIVVCIFNVIKIKKILCSSTSSIKLLIKFTLISLIIGLMCQWINNLLILIISPILSMFVVAIISAISFIILCYAFNVFDFHFLLHLRENKNAKKV